MKPLKMARRQVLFTGLMAGAALAAPRLAVAQEKNGAGEAPIPATEDLMREHGVLERIMLIYEAALVQMLAERFLPDLKKAVEMLRKFGENYHEKLEEEFIFPAMTKKEEDRRLVEVLVRQHQAGEELTDRLLRSLPEMPGNPAFSESTEISYLLTCFIRMYRPHMAREDTVLFKRFRERMTESQLNELGERFEAREHEIFGEGGVDDVVKEISVIEQRFGIYELDTFTPPALAFGADQTNAPER